jgi:hypothetical protein
MTFDAAAKEMMVDVHREMGVDAVFSPLSGDDVACRVIVRTATDYAPGGGRLAVSEPQVVIVYRREEIARRVVRNETFTVGSVVYRVRSMAGYPDAWTAFQGKAAVVEV